MILGTITTFSSGTGVTLTIDGETSPTTKEYMFLASYSPTIGDRVLIEEISGSYVVIGKVTNTPGSSGHAATADYATTAGTANSATTATTAGTADYANVVYGPNAYTKIYFKIESNRLFYRHGTSAWYKLANQ